MAEKKNDAQEELEHLREITDRLEEDLDEDEAVSLLETAVEKAEHLGSSLEDEES